MLDTLKCAIPITKSQHTKFIQASMNRDTWIWSRFNPAQGEVRLVRVPNLIETDRASYHRELFFSVPETYTPEAKLVLEFSVPKFWYGHNISLLYDWFTALEVLKGQIEAQFGLKRSKLPDPGDWEVLRADLCYAWRFPSQSDAETYLKSLERLEFPYKKPVKRRDSLFFPGRTYSIKVYLKHNEFKANDRKELIKQKASSDWIKHLSQLSEGVLRFEGTFRRKWLTRYGIFDVDDLAISGTHLIWDKGVVESWGLAASELALFYVLSQQPDQGRDIAMQLMTGEFTTLKSGDYLFAKSGESCWDERFYHHPGGGFRVYQGSVIAEILRSMIKRFIGDGLMNSYDQIEQILKQNYNPRKAALLMGFWLYVQQFGVDRAKGTFTKPTFYRHKADLHKVGIPLSEPADNVIMMDNEFWQRFRMAVPSEYVVNQQDDFRDHQNILNLPRTGTD
jgi:Phage replication protein CRI